MKENISKNKVWQIVGVAVLCAVCVLTAVLGVVFGMNHSSEDLNVSKDMSEKPDDSVVIETTGEQGISLFTGTASASADGSTTRTLTAIIKPEDATNKKVDWNIAFAQSTGWANGKNISDYLTIVPSSDGALTATLTCKKAFGTQAIVTCSSREDASINVTAKIDYRKKVVGSTLKMKSGSNPISKLDFCNSNELISFEFVPQYSEYTIDDSFSQDIQFKVASSFYETVGEPFFAQPCKTEYCEYYSFRMSLDSLFDFCYIPPENTDLYLPKKAKNVFKNQISEGMEFLNLKVTYSSENSNATFETTINVGSVDFVTLVTGISLNASSIIF